MPDWAVADIDRMLALLPEIEDPGFVPATWSVVEGEVPYPTYHAVVEQIKQLAFGTSCQVDPYGVLPEDPPGTVAGPGVVSVLSKALDFESASLDQIRRYFVLSIRRERFGDGYIAGEFTSGSMLAAFHRLASIRASM